MIALGSFWPDVLVASAVAAVFLHTAYGVIRDSFAAWRTVPMGAGRGDASGSSL